MADTGEMFTPNWPCSQVWQHKGNPSLFPSAPLLSSGSVRTMDAKVVVITGCSSGIGLSLAVRLASDPQKAFKGNQVTICCVGGEGEDFSPVNFFLNRYLYLVRFDLSSLCNDEKSVQKGTSFRKCERAAQGHLGHTPNGRDQPAVHPRGDGEDCGEANRRSGYDRSLLRKSAAWV